MKEIKHTAAPDSVLINPDDPDHMVMKAPFKLDGVTYQAAQGYMMGDLTSRNGLARAMSIALRLGPVGIHLALPPRLGPHSRSEADRIRRQRGRAGARHLFCRLRPRAQGAHDMTRRPLRTPAEARRFMARELARLAYDGTLAAGAAIGLAALLACLVEGCR